MGGSTLIRPGHGTCLKDESLLVIQSSHFPLEPNNRTRSATSPSMLRSAEDTVELREIVSQTFIIPSKAAPPSRCDRGLPEAVRPGYHSGSRSGQHYPCGVLDRVDRRRSAAACLPRESSS